VKNCVRNMRYRDEEAGKETRIRASCACRGRGSWTGARVLRGESQEVQSMQHAKVDLYGLHESNQTDDVAE
jgi:hypothetical protein